MLNLQKIIIEYCMGQIRAGFRRNFGGVGRELENAITMSAYTALEHISNSDALYHNVEHTVMATLAGQAIIEGKRLTRGEVTPSDWAHFMIALLFHDIGYVKGVCRDDNGISMATGVGGAIRDIPLDGSDAALAPYHVDRSKLFVLERFGNGIIANGLLDADRIASYIELTRFPVPDSSTHRDTRSDAALVRAADFIGQLADPYRMQKCTALFYEFEELGINGALGYRNPGDLRASNARFYWDVVNPYVHDALQYLRITEEGKQWIVNLQANVIGPSLGFGTAVNLSQ